MLTGGKTEWKVYRNSLYYLGNYSVKLFFKKKSLFTNRHIKRCSVLLMVRETQIKTTMRYRLTSVRMAITKKANYKCWWGRGEKGTLIHCWWECKLKQPLWKLVQRFLKNLKTELPCDPAISLLGIYTWKKSKPVTWKDTCTSVFTVALFTLPGYASNLRVHPRWMDKEHTVHIHNGILFHHKKNGFFLSAATWMDLEAIMLS